MNFDAMKDAVTSRAARQILLTQKHSPKILFITGTVGVIGATVLACRATLKVSDALDLHEKRQAELDEIDSNARYGEEASTDYLDKSRENQMRALKIRTAIDITKPYLPAVALGLVSIAALTGSHVVLTKRNGAVMAAYAGLDRAYKEYRQRVAQEYGTDADRKFASGAERVHLEEKLSDGTTKITATDKVKKGGVYGGSPYAVLFDEVSSKYSPEPGRNAVTVGMVQSYANDKLRANGHLFLNEVYDMLGVPRTKAGAIVGWVYRRDNETPNGDNYVSFGVWDGDLERAEAFIDGDETSIWLDFNVDGIIYDKI